MLTGGRSTRMGTDKALLEIDGVAMAVRVADALRAAGAGAIVSVGGDAAALRALGLDHVPDDDPDGGPLAGVVTALAHSAAAVTLVAPCDLVAPAPAPFAALVAALATPAAMVAVPVVDGRWRPLPAAFRAAARASLAAAFASGERALHRAIEHVGFTAVDGLASLGDADTPGDLDGHR